jgi:hypothetical protein
VAILEDRKWTKMPDGESRARLIELRDKSLESQLTDLREKLRVANSLLNRALFVFTYSVCIDGQSCDGPVRKLVVETEKENLTEAIEDFNADAQPASNPIAERAVFENLLLGWTVLANNATSIDIQNALDKCVRELRAILSQLQEKPDKEGKI